MAIKKNYVYFTCNKKILFNLYLNCVESKRNGAGRMWQLGKLTDDVIGRTNIEKLQGHVEFYI